MLRTTMATALWAIGSFGWAEAAPPSSDESPMRTDQFSPPATETAPSSSAMLVAGDWTTAASNSSVIVFEKPATPALGPDGFRRIEVRFEFASPQVQNGSKAYQSLLVLTEFDCAKSRSRNIQATSFADHNLGSPIGPPQQDPGDWQPAEDGSIAARLMKLACPNSP